MKIDSKIASILIPAFNEESVIVRCLEKLGGGLAHGFQVIVICNGCTDRTESIVRERFPEVYLLSLSIGSKSLAIRYAESQKPGFPRIYIDADILLDVEGAKELINTALCNKNCLVIPKSHIHHDDSQNLVKRYYDQWYSTNFVKQLGFGAGTYVLSENARNRFNEWPELIADDGFVRTHFSLQEIMIVEQVYVDVFAPKTFWQLVQIKTRSKLGNKQLRQYFNEQNAGSTTQTKIMNKGLRNNQMTLFSFSSWNYLIVNCIANSVAWWRYLIGDFSWLRDKSSR